MTKKVKGISIASRKNKGRSLAKWYVEHKLINCSELTESDIRFTPSGVTGPDTIESSKSYNRMPLVVELKFHAREAIYKYYEQAKSHIKEVYSRLGNSCYKPLVPTVIVKQNNSQPLAIVDADWFLYVMSRYYKE